MKLKTRFLELIGQQTADAALTNKYWVEIETAHNNKKRVYHNLTHLENLFLELEPIKNQIEDWNTVSWAVFYHDIVYNVRKQDNEERSADLAVERLHDIGYPTAKIERCKAQIIATKSHAVSDDQDANLFTDADLSILGKDWDTYSNYFQAIRKEYKIYPKVLYNPGRKKVLKHFLEMDQLFKTDYFKEQYEKQSRLNIEQELKL